MQKHNIVAAAAVSLIVFMFVSQMDNGQTQEHTGGSSKTPHAEVQIPQHNVEDQKHEIDSTKNMCSSEPENDQAYSYSCSCGICTAECSNNCSCVNEQIGLETL